MAVIRHRRCPEYQFGARLAFMQLLKASALLPAVDNAAWRSQSDASRLRLFVLCLSLGQGLLLSYGPDEYGRGGAQPAKSIIATSILVFIYDPLPAMPPDKSELDFHCEQFWFAALDATSNKKKRATESVALFFGKAVVN